MVVSRYCCCCWKISINTGISRQYFIGITYLRGHRAPDTISSLVKGAIEYPGEAVESEIRYSDSDQHTVAVLIWMKGYICETCTIVNEGEEVIQRGLSLF